MNLKKTAYLLIFIFCFAFLLNFLWESLHGFSLYTDHIIDSDKYVRMMVYMSLLDAVTILVMYLVCAFFMKDILWLNELSRKRIIIFFVIGLIVAVTAEYWAVYVTHEWHYNKRMPIIFGIGLSPFIQLSITGIFSLWMAKRVSDL